LFCGSPFVSFLSEQAHLLSGLLVLEFHQPGKTSVRVIENASGATFVAEDFREPVRVGARALIAVPEYTDVPLFHAGKMLVQSGVKILAVS
jgi:hypothetical protein